MKRKALPVMLCIHPLAAQHEQKAREAVSLREKEHKGTMWEVD